jgi:hypothetical protein
MAISAAECHQIDQRFKAALRHVKATRPFELEVWATSYAIPEDPDPIPTFKEMKRVNGSGDSWKAQGGAVLKGRPKIASPLCQVCQVNDRYTGRSTCLPCFNTRRNKERAEKRKNK